MKEMYQDQKSGAFKWREKQTMKKETPFGDWLAVAVFAAILLAALLLPGCVSPNHQILVKQTTFGLQIGASPLNAGIPQIQFGLIRNSYIANPTDTNKMFAAPLESHVKADIGLTSQSADETIVTKP